MKILKIAVLIALFALAALAQTNNFAAGGLSYNPGASPAIAGTGMYARLLPGMPTTYSFTSLDAVVTSTTPFSVGTNIATGVAQKLITIGKVDIYVATGAGMSWQGSNSGWTWNGGFIAPIAIKNGWSIAPSVRFVKSSVNNNSNYQLMGSLLIGKAW